MGFFLPSQTAAWWRDSVSSAGHRGIHNHSFGTIASYFGLLGGGAQWVNPGALHVSVRGRAKTWLFEGCEVPAILLEELRAAGPIYSQDVLPNSAGSKFREVSYDLEKVFDPSSYPDKKKRYQRLTYPPRWMEREGFSVGVISAADLPALRQLHDAWVERKLAQPETFQMMFPRQRYYECCRLAAENPEWFLGLKIERAGEICAARVLYIEGSWAFDLAQFAGAGLPSNATEYFAHATMSAVRDRGVKHLNCGATMGSGLSGYKHHWPYVIRTHWAYSRLKKA